MLVAEKQYLSQDFRDWLNACIARTEYKTPNRLALEVQVDPSHLGKILRGVAHPSEPVMRAIAPKLHMGADELVTRSQVDLIGGIERIRRDMPEAFKPGASAIPPAIPAPDPLDSIQPPLSDLERPVARRILDLNGGQIEDLNFSSYELRALDRLAFLQDRLRGLERQQKPRKLPKAKESKQ